MKKAVLISSIVATCFATQPAFASTKTENQQAATVISSTVSGAFLAGPLGAFAGAVAGSWLSEKIGDASQKEQAESSLANAEEKLQALSVQLAAERQLLAQSEEEQRLLAQQVLDAIQLETFFDTGKSELSERSKDKLAFLSGYLAKNPHLAIQLDGYADPRGSEEANLQLSKERVTHVYELLVNAGISASQISKSYHGETMQNGEVAPYALQRVVRIAVRNTNDETRLASR